jgi:hypothetical protein
MIVVCFTPKSGPSSPEFRGTFSDGTKSLEKNKYFISSRANGPLATSDALSIRCSKDFLCLQVGGRETINRIAPKILPERKKIRE